MIRQYPHTIKLFIPAASTRDENGNWIPSEEPPTIFEKYGRAELKSANAYVKGEDGIQFQYSCIIYLPLPIITLSPGINIQVWDGNDLIAESHLKQFSKGQFNAKAWI